jgi:two-component system OmpR family response regulator
MRLLVVEDEAKLARLLARGLQEEGYAVDVTARGADAVWMAQATPYDAILLDVMLPDLNGFDVARRLRTSEVWSPVLMLTARDAVDDRVAGLDAGADDYLPKPFAFDELLARVRALVRRTPTERRVVFDVDGLRFDRNQRRVWRDGVELDLSPKELALLELFMRKPGTVLTRSELLDGAWDISFERRSNVVDVYVRSLREKIDRPFGRASIETVRGIGYRLRDEV